MKTLTLVALMVSTGCLDMTEDVETETLEEELIWPGTSWLANGGFEDGVNVVWTFAGSASRGTIYNGFPLARSGVAHARLAGGNFVSTASVSQNVTIPSTAKTAKLSFYLDVSSQESMQYPRDRMTLKIYDRTTGNLVRAPIFYYSSLQSPTAGSYPNYRELDMLLYKGRQLRIEFSAWTDGTQPTMFRLDDIALTGTEEYVSTPD